MEHDRTNADSTLIMPPESQVGIVHDLGNLIQIASSALNIIGRNPDNRISDLDGVIARARISLDRAGAMVRQSLIAGRDRAAAARPVNLAACLSEVQTLLLDTWDSDIELDIKFVSEMIFVKCNALALQNAVVNLVLNARDAMPDGGRISVEVAPVLLGLGGPGIEVRVVDTGIGMTPETIARAFEPFFTTKRSGLGGVGLPMVERFALDAGGKLLIESQIGAGTVARLQLPAIALPGTSY
jgi:signal transduction histidine kinase